MTQIATDATTAAVDSYIAMLNEPDRERRTELMTRAFSPEARYSDPLSEIEGYGGLHALAEGVHVQFAGHRFTRTSGVDRHHDRLRFAWDLRAPDGSLTAAGIDVGEVDGDGRLRRITGFFDDLPAA